MTAINSALQFHKLNPWAWLRVLSDNNVGIIANAGTPTNGTSGTGAKSCGPGCLLIDTTNGLMYINSGTRTSPTWVSVGFNTNLMQRVTGTIASADITGTAAGQLGHANGVVLQAAPGANVGYQLVAFGLYYTFATAAYTAGGNLTVNNGAGGAALSGLVSAANSLGAASSKANSFVPLAAAALPVVSNASLNLVSSAAFTQPGTAAGTVSWELWYRKLNVGF